MARSSPRMATEARCLDRSVAESPTSSQSLSTTSSQSLSTTSSQSLSTTRSALVSSLVRETWPMSKLADDAGRNNRARLQYPPLNLKNYRLSLSSFPKQDATDSTSSDESLALSPDLKTLAAAFKSSPPLWASREIREAIKRQESGRGEGWYWRAKPVQENVLHSMKPGSGAASNVLFPSLRHFVSCKEEELGAVKEINAECTSQAVGTPATDKQRPRLCSKDKNVGVSEAWRLIESFPYGSRTSDCVHKRSATAVGSQMSRTFAPVKHQLRPSIQKHQDRPYNRTGVTYSSPVPVDLTVCQETWKHWEKAQERNNMADGATCGGSGQCSHDKHHAGGARGELTCLQLADTILCQTKVRYVDILERSVSWLDRDCLERRSAGAPSPGVRSPTNDVAGQVPPKAQAYKQSQTTQEEKILESGVQVAIMKVTQAADIGKKTGETGNVSSDDEQQARRTSFPKLDSADRRRSGKVKVTDTGKGGEFTYKENPSLYGASRCAGLTGCSKKPILKSSQQRWPAHGLLGYDVLPARFTAVNSLQGHSNGMAGSDLHVTGTTVHSVATGNNGSHQPHPNKESNRKCPTTCDAGDFRKRAVRFSVSDQIYVFAPSDPVVL